MPTVKKPKKKVSKASPETSTEEVKSAPKGKYSYAHGKRKTAIALVKLYPGKGDITINEKSIDQYCTVKTLIGLIKTPLKITDNRNKFDIYVKVVGGGINAQAEAIRHGISKALVEIDPTYKSILKKEGLITRDSRIKERKKFGLKRARKAPQFSKR